METEETLPVIVEGDWIPAQSKSVKNKLQVYFQSKKKSGGGECRVEAEDGALRAAVYFRAEEVRERVLACQNHKIIVDGQTVKLRLSSEPSPTNEGKEAPESVESVSVVLDNVRDNISSDLLVMMVENISGLDDSSYSLEVIYESNRAVVTFNSPADVEKFLSVSPSNKMMQKLKLTARRLEVEKSVQVEKQFARVTEESVESVSVVLDNVRDNISSDLLVMMVENISGLDDSSYSLEVIYESNRAVVTFNSPADVEKFLSVSPSNKMMQKLKLTARRLEVEKSVQVEKQSARVTEESVESVSVVLDNVRDNISRDLLVMMVESISGLDDGSYSLEVIYESNRAVVTFNSPADVEKFLSMSLTNKMMQKYKLTARRMEVGKSVRVEKLPETVIEDMLAMFFDKNWALPEDITMIPDEEAAIVTFSDPKVVKHVCIKQDYLIGSFPVKLFPYYGSLGTALYGKERPAWKMPESFTESVNHIIWKYLQMKKLLNSISDQMRPYFCRVNMDHPEAKLSPIPNFLRQKGLTAQKVDMWKSTALDAFRQHMSQYTAFECLANEPAWKSAEADVRLVVKEDALLVFDSSRGVLTVAGGVDSIKKIRAPVENIVLKAVNHIERQTNGISEEVVLSPSMFYILQQVGLQKAAQDISPEMKLDYNKNSQRLTITGLTAEVYKAKAWILEQNVAMVRKNIEVPCGILDFLRSVDAMDMSQHLFTSHGISAIFSIESKGVLLLGSSDGALAAAESKVKEGLTARTLDVEDHGVLKLPSWANRNKQLLDSYNSSKKKTMSIQIWSGENKKITVAGFQNPVKEVSHNLTEFIRNYSRTQEVVHVKSVAVEFIDKQKKLEWTSIEKDNDVKVSLDSLRQRITIRGARLHVQQAKSCFRELTSSLFTDSLSVNKPGAKKFFQSQEGWFQATIKSEFSCVVMLRPENQEEEEEEEEIYEEATECYCKVKTAGGVLVSVSKANICSLRVEAVVNAANEELKHIGGLALALLNAAGPKLQKISNDYVSNHGNLSPGDAIVTDACDLPCKYVVHAVGPRFSDFDRKTAVSHLKGAVKESLRQAERVNCTSIALPAISSGVFGFPVDLCGETIAQAVREYCDSPGSEGSLAEIHLVDNNDNTVKVLATAINKEFSDLEPTMTIPQQAGGQKPWASGGHQWGRGRGGPKQPRRDHDFRETEGRGYQRRGRGYQGRGRGAGEAGVGFERGHHGARGGQSPRSHNRHGGHGGTGKMEQTTPEGLKISLLKGNIQDQTTHVIVNTISEDMNLSQGAISKAILQAAGPSLQDAVRSKVGVTKLQYGKVITTDSFNMACRKVLHVVCPGWDNGGGDAEEMLANIIRYCLEEAETLEMASLSFPAIGTGNLRFPRDVVSRVLLREIHAFSSRETPQHLREVVIVVHPTDSQTVECFTRDFKGQTSQRDFQDEAQEFNESPGGQSASQSQQSSASFSQVSSPSLGVYTMQMGTLTLEVSSGDITKETCDVIINSSNSTFNLQSGVSKAILDSAGMSVQQECAQIVGAPGYQPSSMIMTSGGQLLCTKIMHVFVQNDPTNIKEIVYSVLKMCEEHKFKSVAFPALGTGKGGVEPSLVADAMVEAVVDFVRKKRPTLVCSVKILIFQASMVTEFHKSMKKKEGEGVEVEEKGFFTRIKDSFTSFFSGSGDKRASSDDLVLETEAFEPTQFELCADNQKNLRQAKEKIKQLILKEQGKRAIKDQYISQLSQEDMDELQSLQRNLTVSIRLDQGQEDEEPTIHLEGLTRDVLTAESAIKDIIQRVERQETLKTKAMLVSSLVEWQFQRRDGTMVPFDPLTNLQLEEARKKKEDVKIKIDNEMYRADVKMKKATSVKGQQFLELLRKDLKADSAPLPPHWEDMKGDLLKLFPLIDESKEYIDVKTEVTKTGLTPNIISIERVQNPALWQGYQIKKKQLEKKNNHQNNEKQLFHGTEAKSIDLINEHGFNRSYAGKRVGALHGNGTYFAVDPRYPADQGYAAADSNGHKRMYLARVLVGDYTKGVKGMLAPPAKSGKASDLYDSVTDDQNAPTMFIVFNDSHAYPEYLITFT